MSASATAEQLALWQRPQARLRQAEISLLAPLMYELAKEAERLGGIGATISDLRIAAVQRGVVLTGREKKRDLSYLGAVPRAAGLEPVPGAFRRSDIPDSHGNLQRVWRLPRMDEDPSSAAKWAVSDPNVYGDIVDG